MEQTGAAFENLSSRNGSFRTGQNYTHATANMLAGDAAAWLLWVKLEARCPSFADVARKNVQIPFQKNVATCAPMLTRNPEKLTVHLGRE